MSNVFIMHNFRPDDDSGICYRNVGNYDLRAATMLSVTRLSSRESGGYMRDNGAIPQKCSRKFSQQLINHNSVSISRVDHPSDREKVEIVQNSGWKRIKTQI